MKKLIAILATVSLTLTVASCGDEAPKNSSYVNSATEAGASSVGGSDAALQAVEEPAEEAEVASIAIEESAENSLEEELLDFGFERVEITVPDSLTDETERANYITAQMLSKLEECEAYADDSPMAPTKYIDTMNNLLLGVKANRPSHVGITPTKFEDRMNPIRKELVAQNPIDCVKVYYTKEEIEGPYENLPETSDSSKDRETFAAFEKSETTPGYVIHGSYYDAYMTYDVDHWEFWGFDDHREGGLCVAYSYNRDTVSSSQRIGRDAIVRAMRGMDPLWGSGVEYIIRVYDHDNLQIGTFGNTSEMLASYTCKIYKCNDGIHDYEQWYPSWYYFGS